MVCQMKKDLIALFNQFAVDHANIGIHAIDCSGRTIIYNEKMKVIEGMNFEELKDRSVLELFTFDQTESTLMKVLQSGKPHLHVKQTYWNRNEREITTRNDTYPIYENGELLGAVEFAEDITALEKMILQPLRKTYKSVTFHDIIAYSDEMKAVVSTAKKAAQTKLPVLLIGEAGTGKEMIAQCIHHASGSTEDFHTFYGLHAAEESLEQLEKTAQEQSDGTLFCERIDALPTAMQKQLLELLQRISVHQVIASIGEDPVALIADGKLLKELYYYFASFTIRIPPLRKRTEDILPFMQFYLKGRNETFGSALHGADDETAGLFLSYDWPGNVRELEFVLDEISSTWAADEIITPSMLPPSFRSKVRAQEENSAQPGDFLLQSDSQIVPLDLYLRKAERYYLEKSMKLHEGNITKTAAALGMSRQNLQYRLRKLKE